MSLYATCITCSGESGGSNTTSEPHLELTASWLCTIKMFYVHVNPQKSILCCLLMSLLGGGQGIVTVLNFVLFHCSIITKHDVQILMFGVPDPSLHTFMYACM